MTNVICHDVCLWITDVGCGVTRCALLALEPGARIWLEIDGDPILFERMQDGPDGQSMRGLKPVGDNRDAWLKRCREKADVMPDLDFVERPLDRGMSSDRYGATGAPQQPF